MLCYHQCTLWSTASFCSSNPYMSSIKGGSEGRELRTEPKDWRLLKVYAGLGDFSHARSRILKWSKHHIKEWETKVESKVEPIYQLRSRRRTQAQRLGQFGVVMSGASWALRQNPGASGYTLAWVVAELAPDGELRSSFLSTPRWNHAICPTGLSYLCSSKLRMTT